MASVIALDLSIGWYVQYHTGALSGPLNGQQIWYIFDCCFVFCALFAARAIRSKYSPNGGVQWLLSKPCTYAIGQCTQCCTGTSARPSKWRATVVNQSISLTMLPLIIHVANLLINTSYKLTPCYHINLNNMFHLIVWFGPPWMLFGRPLFLASK